jgi:hypothetical protein
MQAVELLISVGKHEPHLYRSPLRYLACNSTRGQRRAHDRLAVWLPQSSFHLVTNRISLIIQVFDAGD